MAIALSSINSQVAMGFSLSAYVYVADTGNNRIQAFDYQGNFKFAWGSYGTGNGQFISPHGVAVTKDGTKVYVTDTGNNRVQVFTALGVFLFSFGSFGTDPDYFDAPQGICIDDYFVYVVDQNNNRFQALLFDGSVYFALGSYGSGINQFNHPTNCWVDDVNLYIDDTGNNRLVIYPKTWTEGNFVIASVPMITVQAQMDSRSFICTAHVPLPIVAAKTSLIGKLDASVIVPKITVYATLQSAPHYTAIAHIPNINVSAILHPQGLYQAKTTVPLVIVQASFVINEHVTVNVAVPKIKVESYLSQVLGSTYATVVMNIENTAVTEYTNYQFNSFAEFNGKYYAIGSAGLMRLDGDTDNGTKIQTRVKMAAHDQNQNFVNRLNDIYFTGRLDGPWRLRLTYDETETYDSMISDITGVLKDWRIKGPRGMNKKRFIVPEIMNLNGSDGEIRNLRFIGDPIPQRVR